MMLYEVPSSFIKIDETKGILQNASSGNSLEVSNENEVNSGIILKPGESLSFQDTDIYVRTVGSNKNSAVRVVPFVDGFSADSTPSVNSDFDIRKFNATGILIYSTDPAGTLHEKPVYYVNPASTNSQLVELGKSIVAVTDNSYQATTRITRSLCDGQPDSTADFSKYLVVDSPFATDFADNCGGSWNQYGDPIIQDGKLYLDGQSYLKFPSTIYFLKQPFSIECDFSATENISDGAICIWQLYESKNYRIQLQINTTGIAAFWAQHVDQRVINITTEKSVLDGLTHHALCTCQLNFLDKSHSWAFYLDGSLVGSQQFNFAACDFPLYLGNNKATDRLFSGYIGNFKFYNVALLPD